MNPSPRLWLCAAVCIALAGPAPAHAQKVQVHHTISADQIEAALKDLGISAKKSDGAFAGSVDYQFRRNNFQYRLHNYNGQDLWIDSIFVKMTPEDVNRWNRQARLSRAVLIESGNVSVEAQLLCVNGVTDGMMRQFIKGYEKEVHQFAAFMRKRVDEEEEIKSVKLADLEKLLRHFNVAFKKSGVEGKDLKLEFTMNEHKITLTCHEGATLILRSHFPKMPLERINKYNIDRRYVRASLDTGGDGKEFTALEAYLDCGGGTTESILQNFLRTYQEELRYMNDFVTI